MVLDNQTARLQVGDQVPITVQSATPITGDVDTIVNSIELRDTGVILTVTPRVNAGGLVILEIQQEVSNVVRGRNGDPVGADDADDQSAAGQQHRGGSARADRCARRFDQGRPHPQPQRRADLSSIPIIGVLFSTETGPAAGPSCSSCSPRVIDSPERAQAVTEEYAVGSPALCRPAGCPDWRNRPWPARTVALP